MTSVLLNNQERHFEKTLFLFFLFSVYFVNFTRGVREGWNRDFRGSGGEVEQKKISRSLALAPQI